MNSKPVGLAMYKRRGRLSISTIIKDNEDDSPAKRKLKELVRSMISYKPEDRPSASTVLATLKSILGKCFKILFINGLRRSHKAVFINKLWG